MKLRWILPFITTLIIAALIFWFSSQNADESTKLSRGMIIKLIGMLPVLRSMTPEQKIDFFVRIHSKIRKCAHFFIYMTGGYSAAAMFHRIFADKSYRFVFCVTVSSCCAYAVTDELHQRFVDGRSNELRDVFIDTLGAAIGAGLYVLKKNIRVI